MGLPVFEQDLLSQRPSVSHSSPQPPFNRLFSHESTVSTYDENDYTEISTNQQSTVDACTPSEYLQRRISTDPTTGERVDYALNDSGELRNPSSNIQLNELQLMSANDAITHLLAHTTLLLDRHNNINNIIHNRTNNLLHHNIGTTTQSHHIGYIPSLPTNSTQHINLTPEQQHVILNNVLNELVNDTSDMDTYDIESTNIDNSDPTYTPNNTQSLSTQTLTTTPLIDLTPMLANTTRSMSPTNETPLTDSYWNTRTQSTNTFVRS